MVTPELSFLRTKCWLLCCSWLPDTRKRLNNVTGHWSLPSYVPIYWHLASATSYYLSEAKIVRLTANADDLGSEHQMGIVPQVGRSKAY